MDAPTGQVFILRPRTDAGVERPEHAWVDDFIDVLARFPKGRYDDDVDAFTPAMKTIIHAVHIHAAPPKVYEALTTTEGLSQWWTTQVDIEPGTGGVIRFTFHGDFHPHMRQTALEPHRLVRWSCVAGHPNWHNNTFSFTLDERKGETTVQFVQQYADELSDETYGTYNFNWGYYLNSLKLYCETGTGTPFVSPASS